MTCRKQAAQLKSEADYIGHDEHDDAAAGRPTQTQLPTQFATAETQLMRSPPLGADQSGRSVQFAVEHRAEMHDASETPVAPWSAERPQSPDHMASHSDDGNPDSRSGAEFTQRTPEFEIEADQLEWSCKDCTYINQPGSISCEVCLAFKPRPKVRSVDTDVVIVSACTVTCSSCSQPGRQEGSKET